MQIEGMSILGRGFERVVYPDPVHSDRVRKVELPEWKGLESVEYVKGRFYLTKIIALLLPGAIPTMHASWLGHQNVVVAERILPDKKHRTLDSLWRKKKRTIEEEVEVKKLVQERQEWFQNSPDCRSLTRRLDELGLQYDSNPQNFVYDEQNNNELVYVDALSPWISDSQHLHRGYNVNLLKKAISHLSSPDRDLAVRYLHRLEQLFLHESISYERDSAA